MMPAMDSDNLRLAAALLASLLLHAALALLPAGLGEPGPAAIDAAGSAPISANLSIRLPRRPSSAADRDKRPPPDLVSSSAAPSAHGKTKTDDSPSARTDDSFGIPVDFVAEALLTRRPRPRTPINLNLPEFAAGAIDGKLRATLFIDSSGGVVDFQAGDSNLAAEQVRALGRVFSATKFHPGEIAGQAVNARINIVIRVQPDFSASPASANAVFKEKLR